MKQQLASVIAFALIVQCFAVAHERINFGVDVPRENVQRLWKEEGKADRDLEITVWLAITQPNAENLRNFFEQVSNPKSSAYGKYLSREELTHLMAVDNEVIDELLGWLKSEGIEKVDVMSTRDMLRITAPVATLERVLSVDFLRFSHAESGRHIVRTYDAPSVPAAVSRHVHTFFGVQNFPLPRMSLKTKRDALGVENDPKSLRKMYNVDETGSGQTKSSQGCAEFQGQAFSKDDLEHFEKKFNIPNQPVANSHNADGSGHTEANLDVQYIIGVNQGIPTDMWLQSGFSFDLVEFVDNVISSNQSPLVWSISYGEATESVSTDTAQRLDTEMQKLGALGVSVLIASGDSGVYSRTGGYDHFHPSYPACLPSVTAVGATDLNDDGTETKSTPWSGGGFAPEGYFPRNTTAKFQVDAVSGYLRSGVQLPPSSYYNGDGRAIPDVSAQGVKFPVVVHGFVEQVGGTSASCPTFASIVALVNDKLMQAGKPALGPLNQFLYQNAAALNDITQGDNSNGHQYGFQATQGWDPVTGLGTPDYQKLKKAAGL